MAADRRESGIRRMTEMPIGIPPEAAIDVGEVEETVRAPIAIIERPVVTVVVAIIVDVAITVIAISIVVIPGICAHNIIVSIVIVRAPT